MLLFYVVFFVCLFFVVVVFLFYFVVLHYDCAIPLYLNYESCAATLFFKVLDHALQLLQYNGNVLLL